ncbi:UvrD-helicase domain-containing protein [Propioniciclava coleopterorum]|uniref:RecBCD enzyme subunit RecB n=1 Tax=Propioniciclava coleopterorum TaxID=2714937 RepID=A0A6G7Y911_9ACTN|nr:UvrD-helicase domain-containing protein [Propioniciclava coleopterorum]QIK73283.1 UvrD-helicase domain-containing protein [Propioniciclava coleopterorum]
MNTDFSLTGALPTGTTVLEASAGTGKTYAIAALAARYLADGHAEVDDLLLVTFSRAATAELRLRVRERLKETADALAAVRAGAVPNASTDAVTALLAEGTPDEVEARAERLAAAFAGFDRATIMTTHEFCHNMLTGLGVLAPQTPLSTLVEELTPLADEAAEDVYVRMFAREPHGASFRFSGRRDEDPAAQLVARRAVAEEAELVGHGSPGVVGDRVEFARSVRHEVARRKEERRIFSFDDQLRRLDAALADPETGDAARRRLAERFPVVLVDEFQDTDPVQWSILRRAFHGSATLVLIGDPKQAIYGFRGGDVHTYQLATAAADAATTLRTNFRSDPEVVDAVLALFRGVELGAGITAPRVHAHAASRLVGEPGSGWDAGVQVRVVPTAKEEMAPHEASRAIEADLVGVVADLLRRDGPLRVRATDAPPAPTDIAVLVRSNYRGRDLAAALATAGIPATFTGSRSVFDSPAQTDWVALLQAIDEPRRPFLQLAYLTDFVGATVPDLALVGDEQHSAWAVLLHTWARVLDRFGVPALFAAIDADTGLTARLLARPDGEQAATDHRQLVELLHRQQVASATRRARDLAGWLRAQRSAPSLGGEATRRRATDADAVTVMTIHRAKGLQWPIVLLPEAGDERPVERDRGAPLVLPLGEKRLLDIGGRGGPARPDRWRRHLDEDGDESLRAFYVGATRAQSRVLTWWAPQTRVVASPLHRLLHAPHDAASPQRPAAEYPLQGPEDRSPLTLGWLPGAGIAAVRADAGAGTRRPRPPAPSLDVRPWNRVIDHDWRRTSYSGLTAAAHDLPVLPEAGLLDDEPAPAADVAADPAFAQPSPMTDLPAGAAFGTLVHAVYEAVDATGEQWRDALEREAGAALRRWPLPEVEPAALAAALAPSFTTPLGPLLPGRTLRDFSPRDRLAEMDFEFALDNPRATVADLAALLAEHLPSSDPLAAYPERLAQPLLAEQRLHGFLTGSIDAVLRDGEGADARFVVVDYKTNRLSAPGEPVTVGHYTREAMAEAMMGSHYPLQALLYSVALHRFLARRWSLYEPGRHLGGVGYLFVRGMAGPDTPAPEGHPLGVFSWSPSTELVLATSALLRGERR